MRSTLLKVSWQGRAKASKDWLCASNIEAQMNKGAWMWDVKNIKVREYEPRKRVCRWDKADCRCCLKTSCGNIVEKPKYPYVFCPYCGGALKRKDGGK